MRQWDDRNVCFIKIRSKLSSVLLSCLLRIFMKQTLPSSHHIISYWRLSNFKSGYLEWHSGYVYHRILNLYSKLSISHTKSIAENWVPLDTALLLQHYSIAQGEEEEAEKKEDENILAQLQKRELNFNFRYRKQPPIQIVYGAKGRRNRGARWILGIP